MRRCEGLTGIMKSRRKMAGLFAAASILTLSNMAGATAHKAKSTPAEPPITPGECRPTPDQASVGMRALQTELMVAGLKCSAEQWNLFTAKFKTTIKSDADRLQRLFIKAYGKGGANEMNAFVTQLANEASQRSNGFSEADYCKQQDVLFQQVLSLTGMELERFSAKRDLSVPAPVALCKPDADKPVLVETVSATKTAQTR